MGSPLNFDAIEEFKKSTYTSNREINAFTMAGSETAGSRAPQCYSPSGLNLNDWNRHAGKNFLLADLLEDHCPDRIRGQNGDKLEIECPFEHTHSETGGTACFVMNSIDSNTEHWIWKCHHDSCQGRHRLEFLEEALRAGWFDEVLLSDAVYLLEGPDELERQDAASTDIETANPLESVYDERLIDPSGFLRRPEDAAPLYDALGVKVPREGADEYSDKLERAYAKMVTILRDQIKEAMRTRFSYVVTPDGAKAAIRIAKGTPPVFYSEAALERLFRNREVSYFNDEDKVKKLQPHTLFFYDRERDTFDGTCFEPTASAVPEHKFNIWTGFTVEPKQGDWSKLRDHVRGVLCGGDDMLFQWFMTWIASPFARPGVKVPSSVAIRGEQGTGKSKLFDWLREAMGCAAMKVSQGKHLTGSFNAHLDGKLLLVCEEAFWAGDRAAAGVIKDLITADELTVEAKFENAVTRPNRLSVAFISNNSWIVPTDGKDARRFLVLEASDARKEDAAYFKAIDKQMREGGLEAMVYDLVNWDPANIGGWDVLRKPPKTDGLRQQARMGLSGPMAELIGIIEEGILSGKTTDGDAFYYDLSDKESTRVARSHVNAVLGIKKGRGNETVEGRAALEELLGNDANHRSKDVIHYRGEMQDGSRVEKRTDARVLYVEFPPLEELRSELVDYGEDR
ncbi:virulence-associated E family protein [Ruegeria marisrubri]|uniref:primase-helicase family protein n=1 Tax=Ruegeria marisrubri TaxID=1685379 RepID=UPI001CD55C71|nr:primase-helicase family protein [Ruegeria marisrubri]MCA0906260.1 virulence-associated E family protein [Ruegeria marisrubri]